MSLPLLVDHWTSKAISWKAVLDCCESVYYLFVSVLVSGHRARLHSESSGTFSNDLLIGVFFYAQPFVRCAMCDVRSSFICVRFRTIFLDVVLVFVVLFELVRTLLSLFNCRKHHQERVSSIN